MESNLPEGCQVKFDDPNALYSFHLHICPTDGFWSGGNFQFSIFVPEEYNIAVSITQNFTHFYDNKNVYFHKKLVTIDVYIK